MLTLILVILESCVALKPLNDLKYGSNDLLQFKNGTTTIEDLANRYKPLFCIGKNYTTPTLQWIWYEIIPDSDNIILNYYTAWENEKHPNIILDFCYSVVRFFYYGFSLKDIEYIQELS